jgi:hypothetical protein
MQISSFIVEVSKFTIQRISIITPKGENDWHISIFPFLDDFSFLADYYLSFAISCHFLTELNVERSKMQKLRDIAHEQSIEYAKMVRDVYTPWCFITSERQLKEVKAEEFLTEVENLFGRQVNVRGT